MKTKIIFQKMLSAECWPVQVWGIEACKDCDFQQTIECGGKQILKTGKNTLGNKIPLLDTRRNHES
jgi:hypothetical protein